MKKEEKETKELTVEEKKRKKMHLAIELCVYAVLLFFAGVIVPKFLLQRIVVDGDSMQPTLYDKENIWVEKVSYHFDQLNRFDVIVFYPYGKEYKDYFVKRIVGMPGERIQIVGDTILINGEPLEENYGKDPITDPGIAEEEILLADDEYFVLGDNRAISMDSRSSLVGPAKKKDIDGRAFMRIWPLNKLGSFD